MAKNLKDYDFFVAIDKSGSMSKPGRHDMSRWKEAQETTIALATKAAEFDDDGITVIPFANTNKVYDNVTPAKVEQVFAENDPMGGTDTAGMLTVVFDLYRNSKASNKTTKPVILTVVTDGEPNDKEAVKRVIRSFASTLSDNGSGNTDEFGILFLQVGDDPDATAFLKELDDNLGAKFDIVATKTSDELEGMTLTEAFIHALEG